VLLSRGRTTTIKDARPTLPVGSDAETARRLIPFNRAIGPADQEVVPEMDWELTPFVQLRAETPEASDAVPDRVTELAVVTNRRSVVG